MTDKQIAVYLRAITGPYNAAMAQAGANTAGFAATAEGTSRKTGMLSGAFGGMAGKLMAAGGVLAGLKVGSGLLEDYEDALVGVGKTTGLTGSELSALGDDLTALGGTIEGSAEDMLGIAQTAAQLGVKGSADILEFTEVVAGIASATDLTTEAAATDMARLANIMRLPMSEMESLGDVIVNLGNNMATTEPEILAMGQRIAAAGDLAGLSADQVMALAAAASSVGLEAEAGGTALSQVLRGIEEATQSGGAELETFAAIAGQSAGEFAEAWTADPQAAFLMFIEGLGQVRDEGGNVAEIFDTLGLDGMRVSDTLLRLSGNSDMVASSFDVAADSAGALGEEVEAANSRMSVARENLIDGLKAQAREWMGNEEGASAFADVLNVVTDNLGLIRQGLSLASGQGFQPFSSDVDRADESLTEMADRLGIVQTYTADARGELDAISGASAAFQEAIDGNTDALTDEAAAFRENVEVGAELADQMLASVDPMFAFAQASRRVEEAEAAAAEAVRDHGAASEEAEDASLALIEAHLRLDDAALRSGGSADAAAGYIDGLARSERVAGQAADIAAGHVRRLGEDADRTAGTYGIYFDVSLRGMQAATDRLNALAGRYGKAPGRARGGPVYPDGTYWVGEEGPELFRPASAGTIIPAGPSAAMTSGGVGGGMKVESNVNVHGLGVDEAASKVARKVDDNMWMAGRLAS